MEQLSVEGIFVKTEKSEGCESWGERSLVTALTVAQPGNLEGATRAGVWGETQRHMGHPTRTVHSWGGRDSGILMEGKGVLSF